MFTCMYKKYRKKGRKLEKKRNKKKKEFSKNKEMEIRKTREKENRKKNYTRIPVSELSLVMRKPAFCICENKDPDQLRSNCAADQCLYFRCTDSTIPLLST